VYIRTAGPAKYNRLFAGRLPFDHSSVIEALRRITTVLNDRYVVGGIDGALGTGFGDAIGLVFFAQPRAHLYMEGGFVGSEALYYVKPTPKPGRTIGAAPFPTIDPRFGSPLVVGGDFAAALDDNEAVRELVAFLRSPEAASLWVLNGPVVSPHRSLRPTAYPNVLARTEAFQLARATVVRFDGSDLLPGSLAELWGSTLQKVLRRPDDIPNLVADFQRRAAPVFKR
jgi:alpha-glucoside transport system substrate-binding protein